MPYLLLSKTLSNLNSKTKPKHNFKLLSLFQFSKSLKIALKLSSKSKFRTRKLAIPKTNSLHTDIGGVRKCTQYRYPTTFWEYRFSRKNALNGDYANSKYHHSQNYQGNIRYAYICQNFLKGKEWILQSLGNFQFSNRFCILSLSISFSLPLYSQTQGNEPTLLVAPIQGPINTEFQEFGPTMTPDAKTLYFYSKRSNRGYTEIFKSERKKDGTWDFPEEVDVLNSPFDDQSPFISRDGKTLLLSSNRDGSVEVMLPDGKVGISRDLYVSNWNGKEWGSPVALPAPINTEEIEENPHLLGDTLLFTRYPFGKPNLAKVYFSQYKGEKWSEPKLLPSPINDNYATIAAAFNDEGNILFFSSNRPGGYGGFDLYMAKIDGDSFKDIENLGAPINSSEDEAYIVFQQVKKTFLFCRRVEGRSFDLFTASVPKQENLVQKKLEETKKISLDSVYFERASSILKPESSVPLDAIVDFLHENSDKKMKIIGHTDLTGTFEDNMVLSKERAESVKQYLVSKGVDPKRLMTDGKGPTQPVVQATDEVSSKKNRRTEFVLTDP